jgi:hypothetical protein
VQSTPCHDRRVADPPRLDGAQGWRAVAVAFAAMATTFRIAYSFGAFLLGAVGVVVLLVSAAFVRAAGAVAGADYAPLRPRLRQPAYLRLYAAGLLLSVALFVPFVHLPS